MKKSILILSAIVMMSCGSETEEKESTKELTYDEKVEAVCDCFDKADESNFMKCAKLQDDYHKSLEEDKRQEFLLTTNQCM